MPGRTDPELVRAIATAEAARPLAAYSQAVVAGGFVFCSGTAGVDPGTGDIPEGIREQTDPRGIRISIDAIAVLPAAPGAG